ncbi:GNAT family N-acetyltransferase [Brevibacillus choshinensis]|uniref:GNAT family N-acetyltransferase n=1 Tax=Brevibacillus choshinensis TaxID=54911 RepID=UPI002E1BC26F|nr:GNAT family N-acetyltransferase [Brevibacillus choshinensis]MED4583204.1 GNAT family N-acetyltransferase [Brevibacillus choshinensis]MED4781299.1 GNAT family N-acetyltransferase [Brevibacillus choshinensis]
MSITFRKLTEPTELQQVEALEGDVWNTEEVIPYHMTITIAKFGGLFMGAFDDDKMIGFLYSFPGYTHGEPHLCSHMLGFLPAYRKQGLGVKMKWLQREEALAMGHTKITWTYDPLETVNGILNIVKLGGIVRSYLPDCYGELDDEFNRGLPTDRFLVEWFLESHRVERLHDGRVQVPDEVKHAPEVLTYEMIDELPRPLDMRLDLQDPVLSLPVPAHFQEVKRRDMDTARAWRKMTSELFQSYMEKGYTVTYIVRDQDVVRYVLDKQPLPAILNASSRG